MRKHDEGYPCPERGSGDKGTQNKGILGTWRQRTKKLVDRFTAILSFSGSQTFLQNNSRVVLAQVQPSVQADIQATLLEVLQVNIILDIDFGNDHQLQEARRFLEKCRNTVSVSCELTDYLQTVAHRKDETLASSRKQFFEGVRRFAQLLEIREQSRVMSIQFGEFIDKTHVLQQQTEESDRSNQSKSLFQDNDEDSFETDLALSYIETILNRFAEGNEVLADVADFYWDYLPVEVQEYLFADMQHQLKRSNSFSNKKTIHALIPEVTSIYIASISRLENSVSRARTLGEFMPKVRLSELDSRCLSGDVSNDTTLQEQNELGTLTTDEDTGYTLEELLEGMTPENSHEAADWGEPVGNEIW